MDPCIHGRLAWFAERYDALGIEDMDMIVAAITLVNFPRFKDVHEVIFNVLDARYEPNRYHYSPKEWEIFVKYRQLLSEFLTDERRSGPFFIGTVQYLKLAKYFWSFLTAPTTHQGQILIRGSVFALYFAFAS